MNLALREVRLHGRLGKQFGRVHRLAVASAGEAIGALCAVLPGFERALRERSAPGYHVFVGKRAKGRDLAANQLHHPVGEREPILVVPALTGAKRQGALQTILGAVLVVAGAVASAYGYGAIGQPMMKLGVSLMIGGVIQMLTAPRPADRKDEVETRSYAFSGVVNTDEEGLPVPVAIGRVFVGGARVSAGLTSDEIAIGTAAPINPATLPGYMPYDPLEAGGFGSGDASDGNGNGDGSDSDGVGPPDGFGPGVDV